MLKPLRDHFARIDARSLGLFRVVMGLVLIGDLFGRLRWGREFYSNEGVLPNHNHLFNLRGKQEVFSVFHAFSTQGEGLLSLWLTLLVYLGFLLGWHTRVFHVLSLALFVSLTSRNLLAEGVGSYAAIALLFFTVFLPCGSRFSLDGLKASMALRDEQSAADLNDRRCYPRSVVDAVRLPGWSPVSVAALGVLVQIGVIYACSWLQKSGAAWQDGSALHYALHDDLRVSGIGAWLRGALGSGPLTGWTFALRYAEIAIPVLLLVPFAFRWTRLAAAGLMVFHGLSLVLLFQLGLYGGALVAAAMLVVPEAAWDRFENTPQPARMRTVIYDADCGVCLWLARVLRRLDLRGHVTFQGNDDRRGLLVRRTPSGPVKSAPLPAAITEELVDRTIVVVDPAGKIFVRSRAIVEILRVLPLGWLALPLALPGVSHLLDGLYDAVASRRHRISVLMGKTACGIRGPVTGASVDDDADEVKGEQTSAQGEVAEDVEGAAATRDDEARGETESNDEATAGPAKSKPRARPLLPAAPEVSPARRTARHVAGAGRELGAALVLAAMVAQTVKENPVPEALAEVPQGPMLAAIASWSRMMGRWDLMAPEPLRSDEVMVIDAQMRNGESLDLFTGVAPEVDLSARPPLVLGPLWGEYLHRVRRPEYLEYQRAFRDYLGKGGPLRGRIPSEMIVAGVDAYWVAQPIAPPGETKVETGTREKLFSHGKGGLGTGMDKVPLVRAGSRR
ncbi:DCC1-like thiol-disulfide oxidoreductase family protein [Chondromyces crocatus]|uniref:HTTM-like domain-containing protein n=1 Tax=Chondromyces crocatus TaxID=52 RepID=A0A0K1E5U7_CHOCO|nr:DCC1-like thiol-disulfide oxidoreductase family protein [Chondromyces crocatus]AKT36250.1 uncharacterized protein CMC5_003640 [Chondromyces crocatus]